MCNPIRPISGYERALINKILDHTRSSIDVPPHIQPKTMVVEIQKEGTIVIQGQEDKKVSKFPAEAFCEDIDGTIAHALLFIRDKHVAQLEIYKDDSSSFSEVPPIESWQIIE